MKKIIKKIFAVCCIFVMAASSPFLFEYTRNIWIHHYVSKKVVGVYYSPEVDVKKRSDLANLFGFQANDERVASGFQVEYNGRNYIVTNMHVCVAAKGKSYLMGFGDDASIVVGQKINLDGQLKEIISVDGAHDLCLLEGFDERPVFQLAKSYSVGDRIYLFGHPRGLAKILRKGHIYDTGYSAFRWLNHPFKVSFFSITTITYGGNSGSPVMDVFGNVVGVLFAGDSRYHTEGYVVPVHSLKTFLKKALD